MNRISRRLPTDETKGNQKTIDDVIAGFHPMAAADDVDVDWCRVSVTGRGCIIWFQCQDQCADDAGSASHCGKGSSFCLSTSGSGDSSISPWKSDGFVIERSRVRVLIGAAGRIFFSRVNFLC